MSDYAFRLTAQQWSNDSYYVASSFPGHELTVIASTKADALTEAERVLGAPQRHRHWRYTVLETKDIRLIHTPPEEPA